MSQKAYLKAPKNLLIVGIAVTALMAIIGIIFFLFLMKEGATIGMIFMAFWVVVVLLIGSAYVYNLANQKYDEKNVAGQITITDSDSSGNFDDKLRKLESLKKDGLITEEEYKQKRSQIMEKKW